MLMRFPNCNLFIICNSTRWVVKLKFEIRPKSETEIKATQTFQVYPTIFQLQMTGKIII